MVHVWQQLFHDGKYIATDNKNPNFRKIGEAYGVHVIECYGKHTLQKNVDEFLTLNKAVTKSAKGFLGKKGWDKAITPVSTKILLDYPLAMDEDKKPKDVQTAFNNITKKLARITPATGPCNATFEFDLL